MKQYVVGGLAAALTVGALIVAAPPASAGCQSGRPWSISQCDGPVQPDGHLATLRHVCPDQYQHRRERLLYGLHPDTRCDVMSPDLHP